MEALNKEQVESMGKGIIGQLTNKANHVRMKERGNAQVEKELRENGILVKYSYQNLLRKENKIVIDRVVKEEGILQMCVYVKENEEDKPKRIIIAECPTEELLEMTSVIRTALDIGKSQLDIHELEEKQSCYFTDEAKRIFVKRERDNINELEVVRTVLTPSEQETLKDKMKKKIKEDKKGQFSEKEIDDEIENEVNRKSRIYTEGIILRQIEDFIQDSLQVVSKKVNIHSGQLDKMREQYKQNTTSEQTHYQEITKKIEEIEKETAIYKDSCDKLENVLEARKLLLPYSLDKVKLNEDGNIEMHEDMMKEKKELKAKISIKVGETSVVLGECPLLKTKLCEANLGQTLVLENKIERMRMQNILEELGFSFTSEGKDIIGIPRESEEIILRTQFREIEKKDEREMQVIQNYQKGKEIIKSNTEELEMLSKEKESYFMDSGSLTEVFEKIQEYSNDQGKNEGLVNVDTMLGRLMHKFSPLAREGQDISKAMYGQLQEIRIGCKIASGMVTGNSKLDRYNVVSKNYYEASIEDKMNVYLGARKAYDSQEIEEEEYSATLSDLNNPKLEYERQTQKREETLGKLKKSSSREVERRKLLQDEQQKEERRLSLEKSKRKVAEKEK